MEDPKRHRWLNGGGPEGAGTLLEKLAHSLSRASSLQDLGDGSEVQGRGGSRATEPSSVWCPKEEQSLAHGEAGLSGIMWGQGRV